MEVGFIGLGRMGRAMARRVLDAGHALTVYNRSPGQAAAFAQSGAAVASSPAQAAASGIALSMLADDAALEATTAGAEGVATGLPEDGIHVVMGTHSTQIVAQLGALHAGRGQSLIAAPMLGRPEAVEAGLAGIIVAGPPEAVARCAPLFAAIGRRTFDAGPDPKGAAAAKIANNFLLGCAIEAMGEAFALTEKHGVDAEVFLSILTEGLFAAPAYKVYGKLIADKSFGKPGFTALLGLKDVTLALDAGKAAGVPLPSANVFRDQLIAAIAHGEGEQDWAVVARQQARNSGLA